MLTGEGVGTAVSLVEKAANRALIPSRKVPALTGSSDFQQRLALPLVLVSVPLLEVLSMARPIHSPFPGLDKPARLDSQHSDLHHMVRVAGTFSLKLAFSVSSKSSL